jgi:methyl-accepting chemotaxis protein
MFKNLSVRGKLTLAFGALSLLVLIVAAVAIKALGDSNERFTNYVGGIKARSDKANDVRTAVDRRAIAARNLVLVKKPAELEVEKAAVQRAHEDVVSGLAELNRMLAKADDATDEGRKLVGDITRVEQSYGPVALSIVNLALTGKHDEAIEKMNSECRPLLAALLVASDTYDKYTTKHAESLVNDAKQTYATQRAWLIAACVMALAAAVLAGVLIARQLSQALGAEPLALGLAAQRIAAGDLGEIDGAGQAPQGSVLSSLGMMQGSLAAIVSQVRGASDSIATGSAQISTGNADLSQRTEEQASALQQTAATMSELGSTVKTNAESAQQANQLALGASAVAQRGGEMVTQVVQTMKGIDDSSRRIADIITVIDGIAFQTNILALNAAVEAARAGEQGRGFAVVASEVRSLAQRSAEAAKEIKGLINTSVERVSQGTQLVDRAGATMIEIVASIKRVTDIVGEISASSTEQSAGVSQVGQAVGQIDQVTQQNAALVEESAAAAESLKAQAQQLVQAVSVFRVDGDAAQGQSASHRSEFAKPQVKLNRPTAAKSAFKPAGAPSSQGSPALAGGADGWDAF